MVSNVFFIVFGSFYWTRSRKLFRERKPTVVMAAFIGREHYFLIKETRRCDVIEHVAEEENESWQIQGLRK